LQINLVLWVERDLKLHNVSNLTESCLVKERLELGAEGALEQASNCLGSCSLLSVGKSLHRAANEDELLLEVVETNNRVDFVPVVDASFKKVGRREFQVDVLVEQDVEERHEQNL